LRNTPALCSVALVAAFISIFAHASRPLITDDAHLLDTGTCQVESYYRHERAGHEWGALPTCNPWGLFELQIGGTRAVNEGERDDRVIVQAKTIVKPALPNSWGMALTAGAQDALRPGATRRFGDAYVNVPLTISWRDDTFMLHVNGGLDHDRYERTTRYTWGIAGEAAASDRLSLMAEAFSTGARIPFWQAGGRVSLVPQRVQVDATLGGQWRSGLARFWSVGLRVITPPL